MRHGSDGYMAWLDDTLDVREMANKTLTPAEFDFRSQKNTTGNARLVAGYCTVDQQERPEGIRHRHR